MRGRIPRFGLNDIFPCSFPKECSNSAKLVQIPPKPANPNSHQLAEHLGLSRWTISRVLNGHSDVSEKTRKRVMDAVAELGYRPNVLARGLRGGRTGVIGISFQEIESPILAKKVGRLQRTLREAELRGILELNGGNREAEISSLQHFIDFGVDAIVLFGSRLDPTVPIIREILARQLPVLAIDPEFQLPVPTISLDRGTAMAQVIQYLRMLKHEQFVLLGLNSDPIYGPLRETGIRNAILGSGFQPEDVLISLGKPRTDLWSYEYGHSLGKEWMELPNPPHAAIALNDRIAIGAMRAVSEAGHRIPEDFSIVGFDNLDIGLWTAPSLTTVSQETTVSTRVIVEMLHQLLADGETDSSEKRVILPKLIVRGSTGSVPL